MKRIILIITLIITTIAYPQMQSKVALFKTLDKYLSNELLNDANDSFQKMELLLISNDIQYDFLYLNNLSDNDTIRNYKLFILPDKTVMNDEDYKFILNLKNNDYPFIVLGSIFKKSKDKIVDVTADFCGFESNGFLKSGDGYFSNATKYSFDLPIGLKDFFVIKDSLEAFNIENIILYNKDQGKTIIGYQNNILYSSISFNSLPVNFEITNAFANVIKNFIYYYLNIPIAGKIFDKDKKTPIFINCTIENVTKPIEDLIDTLKKVPINFIVTEQFKNYKPYIKNSEFNIIPVLFESDIEWYKKEQFINKFNQFWNDYNSKTKNRNIIFKFMGNSLDDDWQKSLEALKTDLVITDYNPQKNIIGNISKSIKYLGKTNNTIANYFNPDISQDTILSKFNYDIKINNILGIPYNLYLNDNFNYPSFYIEPAVVKSFLEKLLKNNKFILYTQFLEKLQSYYSYSVTIKNDKRSKIINIKNNSNNLIENLYINYLIPKNVAKVNFSKKDERIIIERNEEFYTITIKNLKANEEINIPFKND
jgi:hypothetical protein